jgi:protoheme IX farnesyltransferase
VTPLPTEAILNSSTPVRPSGSPLSFLYVLLELTKPRVATLVVFSVAAGAGLAWQNYPDLGSWTLLANAVLGTSLVAAGASVLNQVLERSSDGLMIRTSKRPLPTGRIDMLTSTLFGIILGIAGVGYLYQMANGPLAAIASMGTLIGYVGIYTPMKRFTTTNTLIGAVPGAMPPVLGYLAIAGQWDMVATLLFAILFIWQIPHFLAIAWMYRGQYSSAGLKMITGNDPQGHRTSRQMVLYCLALLVVSTLPGAILPPAWRPGLIYLAASLVAGGWFLRAAVLFAMQPTDLRAKHALRASLLHLPLVLGAWLIDPLVQPRPKPTNNHIMEVHP